MLNILATGLLVGSVFGCGDSESASPEGIGDASVVDASVVTVVDASVVTPCGNVVGEHVVSIVVSAPDWSTQAEVYTDEGQGPQTSFWAEANVSDTEFQDVGPGDELVVQLWFEDPLVASETVPEWLTLSIQGRYEENSVGLGPDPLPSADSEGSLPVEIRNAGVYGLNQDGSLVGFWMNMFSNEMAEMDRLDCLTVRLTIPNEMTSGVVIEPNQTISIDRINWYTRMDGDLSSAPMPLEAQPN